MDIGQILAGWRLNTGQTPDGLQKDTGQTLLYMGARGDSGWTQMENGLMPDGDQTEIRGKPDMSMSPREINEQHICKTAKLNCLKFTSNTQ